MLSWFVSKWTGQFLSATAENALTGFVALEDWPDSFDRVVHAFRDHDVGNLSGALPNHGTVLAVILLKMIESARTPALYDVLAARMIDSLPDVDVEELWCTREQSERFLKDLKYRAMGKWIHSEVLL
jgi:hypothetical protein